MQFVREVETVWLVAQADEPDEAMQWFNIVSEHSSQAAAVRAKIVLEADNPDEMFVVRSVTRALRNV